MKTTIFKRWINLASKYKKLFTFDYDDMITRNGGRPLIGVTLLCLRLLGFHLRSSMISIIVLFVMSCARLAKRQGIKGLVKFLKQCHLAFMQSLGGYNKLLSNPRISRTKIGIPRIIPLVHRRRIQINDRRIIRLWLTLFSLYRVFSYKGELKLSTIYSPSKFVTSRSSDSLFGLTDKDFIFSFYQWFNLPWNYNNSGTVKNSVDPWIKGVGHPIPFIISRSAPYTNKSRISTAPSTLIEQANALTTHFLEDIQRYLSGSEIGTRMIIFMLKLSPLATRRKPIRPLPLLRSLDKPTPTFVELDYLDPTYPYCGKLGLKEEAAGKIRVFAMVDAWTQWLFDPLHRCIFKRLRDIPMDGTFDQGAPISKIKDFGYKRYYSFDLSAATDRLPVKLQDAILRPLLGRSRSISWRKILTDRYYLLKRMVTKPTLLKYAVGQPMGALSSWAMLALSHHYIVQWCWWRLGWRHRFEDYAILGDDIVICNPKVASLYLTVMKKLDVEINLSKSLISSHAFEFAKRYIFKGTDCSPLSFKEINSLGENLRGYPSFDDKWKCGLPNLLSLAGAGYKFKGSYLDKSLWTLGPRYRTILLYYLRSKLSPWQWLCSFSFKSWYILSAESQRNISYALWELYRNCINEVVKRKARNLQKVLKKIDHPSEFSHSLSYQIISDSVIKWDRELCDIQMWINQGKPDYYLDAYVDGMNALLLTLRSNLDKCNACPDFMNLVEREEVDDKVDSESKSEDATFCQEVAIWLSVHSTIRESGILSRSWTPVILETKRRGLFWLIVGELLGTNETDAKPQSDVNKIKKNKRKNTLNKFRIINFTYYTNYFDYSVLNLHPTGPFSFSTIVNYFRTDYNFFDNRLVIYKNSRWNVFLSDLPFLLAKVGITLMWAFGFVINFLNILHWIFLNEDLVEIQSHLCGLSHDFETSSSSQSSKFFVWCGGVFLILVLILGVYMIDWPIEDRSLIPLILPDHIDRLDSIEVSRLLARDRPIVVKEFHPFQRSPQFAHGWAEPSHWSSVWE